VADARVAAQPGGLVHHRGHQLVGVQRALHQRPQHAFARQRGGACGGLGRGLAGGFDLEGRHVDLRRVGGAQDRVARADQHRPRDAGCGDARGRVHRQGVTGVDQPDDRCTALSALRHGARALHQARQPGVGGRRVDVTRAQT